MGEKVIAFYTPAGHKRQIRWQVVNVVKPVLAMGKLEDAGCEVVLKKGKRYIKDPLTKEEIPMVKTNGTYKVFLWTKVNESGPVFSRRG